MKYVSENLPEFKCDNTFKKIYESSKDIESVKDEATPEEKKKLAAELEKQGMSVIKKLNTNFSKFKYAANGNWQAYRDFWEENESVKGTISSENITYKMYDSKYAVGIIKTADGTAELNVWNFDAEEGSDERDIFKTSSKSVISSFVDFYKNTFEQSMREIIKKERDRLEKIKAENIKKKEEEKREKSKEKMNAFMAESLNEEFNQLRDYFQKTWSTDDRVVIAVENDPYLKDKYRKYLNPEFDWYSMSEQDLLNLWDEWAQDERSGKPRFNESINEGKKGGQKKGPKPLSVPDKNSSKNSKSTGKKK